MPRLRSGQALCGERSFVFLRSEQRVGLDVGCPDIFNSRSGPCLAHPDSNHGSCSIATAPEIVPSLALKILTLKASTTSPAHALLGAKKNKTALSAKSLSRAKPREWAPPFFVRYAKGGPPARATVTRSAGRDNPLPGAHFWVRLATRATGYGSHMKSVSPGAQLHIAGLTKRSGSNQCWLPELRDWLHR